MATVPDQIDDNQLKEVGLIASNLLQKKHVTEGEPIETTASKFGYRVRLSEVGSAQSKDDKDIVVPFAMADRDARWKIASELSDRVVSTYRPILHKKKSRLLSDALRAMMLMPGAEFNAMSNAHQASPETLELYYNVKPDLVKLRRKLDLVLR